MYRLRVGFDVIISLEVCQWDKSCSGRQQANLRQAVRSQGYRNGDQEIWEVDKSTDLQRLLLLSLYTASMKDLTLKLPAHSSRTNAIDALTADVKLNWCS